MTLAELRRLDERHVIGTYARQPLAIARGAGARVWDAEGVEYLDLLCGIGVTNLGHCHPAVVEAVREQAGVLMHASNLFFTEPGLRLAERLTGSSLGGKAFFCNSGAEAVEAALKLARRHRAQGEIVSVTGGFHGRTMGALSATAQESKQAPFAPLVPGVRAVAPTAEAITGAVSERTAAVLLEPIQGEGGVHPLPGDVLRAAREACDAHGAALILDEVQTGMGRTGTLWAYEQTGVVPDAITVAKALGGGLPIGALVTGERLADVLRPGDHGSTFAGGPVVARAALAALEVTDDPALLEHVSVLGERLRAAIAGLPGVSDVRGRGLMIGFDLDSDPAHPGAPEVVLRLLREQRVIANATGPATVRLLPPLTLTDADADLALEALAAVLRD